MNKAELTNAISGKVHVSKKEAEDMIEAFVDITIATLKAGNEVNLAGFGAFMPKNRKGRVGVNPQNPTQKIQVPAVIVPKFKAGKRLKDALKGRDGAKAEPTGESAG